jgi:hypothetical protein
MNRSNRVLIGIGVVVLLLIVHVVGGQRYRSGTMDDRRYFYRLGCSRSY